MNLLVYIWWGNVMNVVKDRGIVLRNRAQELLRQTCRSCYTWQKYNAAQEYWKVEDIV